MYVCYLCNQLASITANIPVLSYMYLSHRYCSPACIILCVIVRHLILYFLLVFVHACADGGSSFLYDSVEDKHVKSAVSKTRNGTVIIKWRGTASVPSRALMNHC